MKKEDYEKFMRVAIEEAEISLREGNKGFGAVLVKNGKVITRAHDEEVTNSDPTSHAEINVIRKTSKAIGEKLEGFSLISTHEPCPMCTTAAIWANISEIVYGVSISEAMRLGRKRIQLGCREIIKRVPWKVKIKTKSGVLNEDCRILYNEELRKVVKKFKVAMKTKSNGWKRLEEDLIFKRLEWFRKNKRSLKLQGDDLEKAYQAILLKAEINPKGVPIVAKTEKKIIFHSKNYCPVLETCKIFGLDTRKICKMVYEKPTQKLIEEINPELKFSRNYRKIRPYTNYCEEVITLGK